MKNIDIIKSKSLDDFAEWLWINCDNGDETPWLDWWNERYCENCEAIKCKIEGINREQLFSHCELHEVCRFFPELGRVPDNFDIIKMWLDSESE